MSNEELTCPMIDKRIIDKVFGVLNQHPNEYFYRKNSMDVIVIIMDVIREIIKGRRPGNIDFEIGKVLQKLKNSNLMGSTMDKILNSVNVRKTPFFSFNVTDKLINHVNCGSRLNNLRPIIPIFQYSFSLWHCDGNRDDIVKSCKKEGDNLYSFEESIAGMLTLKEINKKIDNDSKNNLMLMILYGLVFASELNISTFELKEDKIRFRDLGKVSIVRLGSSDNPFAYIKTQYVPLIIDFSTCIIADLDDEETISDKDKKRINKEEEKMRIARGDWSTGQRVAAGIVGTIFIVVVIVILVVCVLGALSGGGSGGGGGGGGGGSLFSGGGGGGAFFGGGGGGGEFTNIMNGVGNGVGNVSGFIGHELIREITSPVYYPFGSYGYNGKYGSHYGGGYGSWEFGYGYKSTPLLDIIGSIDHVGHSTTYQKTAETGSEKYSRLKNDIDYLDKMFTKAGYPTDNLKQINNNFGPKSNIYDMIRSKIKMCSPNEKLHKYFCPDDETCNPGFITKQVDILKEIFGRYEKIIESTPVETKKGLANRQELIDRYYYKLELLKNYVKKPEDNKNLDPLLNTDPLSIDDAESIKYLEDREKWLGDKNYHKTEGKVM
jgi:hypothetical protein